MALSVCLRKLEKATSIEDRIPIYRFLQSKKRLPALCSDEKYIVVLTTLLLKDISSDSDAVLQSEALCTLQSCLCCEQIAQLLNPTISQEIATVIADEARTTEHHEVYTELVSTLSLLVPIMPEILATKLPEVLDCLERHLVTQYAPYVHVLSKVCHLFQRLITEIADSMIPHIKKWTPWVFFPLCHENNEVRDLAMKNLELCIPLFLMMEKTVLPLIVNSVKSHLAKEMEMLYPVQSLYVLKLWGVIITSLGSILHRGCTFINSLLQIVEPAFKSDNEFVHIEALNAWQHLIDNFATNLDILGNSKRLKLLMQPLKLNTLITERIAVAKCKTWWHILWSLDNRLNSNFELISVPLLQYTFSSPLKNVVDVTSTSPATTRSGIKQSLKNSIALGPKMDCVQQLGCEILSRLLEQPKWGSPGGLHSPKKIPNISIMPLKSFISNSIYVQYIKIYVHAAKLAVGILADDDSCAFLKQYIMQLLTSRTARLANDRDQSTLEAISEYFQLISHCVINNQCKVSQIIKLLEDMKMFPKEQLSTHIPSIEYRGNSYNTPLLVLLSIMLEPEILKSSFCNDLYFSAFNHFLSVGQGMLVPLNFISSVMEMLKEVSSEFDNQPMILCKLWSCVCLHLLEIIEKTQEVNQASGSSCDFSATTMVLTYPFQHFLTCDFLQVCDKQLWKNWSNLYKAFARCSALVPLAEANTACEIIATMIQKNVPKKDMHDYSISSMLLQLMQIIVDCIDYAALGKEFSELSPSNWSRREQQKPLHNITSFISLLGNLISVFSKLVEESQGSERRKDHKQLLETTSSLIKLLQKLISNVNTTSLLRALILKLVPYLVPFFNCVSKKQRFTKAYNAQFQQNVEALWSSILTSLQLHYSGPYDSEFLESICPLLEANLLNSHQNNIERTRQFWHATFGCNLHNLTLPMSFKNALKKVKPPLIPNIEVSPIEDTSSSLSPSQIPNEQVQPNNINLTRNGFLKKTSGITACPIQASISIKKRQFLTETFQPPSNDSEDNDIGGRSSSRKKCKDKSVTFSSKNLVENCNEKFVVIKPKKKKRILTEHQKEMKRKRSYVPAMYNELSQETVDIDSQCFSESSQARSSQETQTITIHSSNEDTVHAKEVQNKEKQNHQEPVIILSESEKLADEANDHILPNSVNILNSCDTNKNVNSKMELSGTSNESNEEPVLYDTQLSSIPKIVLDNNSYNENISIVCDKEKNTSQEGNLSEANTIQETENLENLMKNDILQNSIHDTIGNRTTSDRLLVDDNAKDSSKYLTPIKQGMLRLVKNKNRLSNLFPKLSHSIVEVESDLDEEDAVPSSQESPGNMNSNDRLSDTTCKTQNSRQQLLKQCFAQSNSVCNNSNCKIVGSTDKESAAEISFCKPCPKSLALNSTASEEEKVSQCSEVLLNEIGKVSILSSKRSSEESVKIIDAFKEIEKPMCVTIDLTEEASLQDEKIDSCKHSFSLSQDASGDDALQSMQFSISSNNEFQHSIDILSSNKSEGSIHVSSDKELSNDSSNNSKDSRCSPEPKRRSLRRLTPTRRVQEALLTKRRISDAVNYKELFQSRNKSHGIKQQLRSSNAISRLEKSSTGATNEDNAVIMPTTTDTHDICNNIQPSAALSEKMKSSTLCFSISPTVNRVLFPETKQSDRSAINDLLTKPLNSDCLSEEVQVPDNVGEVQKYSLKKNSEKTGASAHESDDSISLTGGSWEVFNECKDSSLRTDDVNHQEVINEHKSLDKEDKVESNKTFIDSKIVLRENDSFSQGEQEQTPKSPILSKAGPPRHSQRQKGNKAAKLKSIELEKLFSEKDDEKKSIHGCSSGRKMEKCSLEAPVKSNTSFEKPKGARKRKNSTPCPTSNLTSPVATRLRARSSTSKQRAMQKSRLRGRPKSRSSSLGIAHRHKPKRLSNVSMKSPIKPQPKDEEVVSVPKGLQNDDKNVDITETRNIHSNEEECEKQDESINTAETELSFKDKPPVLETKMPSDADIAGKDEKILKAVLPDPTWKRSLNDAKNCRAAQRSFNLPISPLSRSQKILRAAIGNFHSIEKSVSWKSSKYNGSPNKPKHINSATENISPDSSKLSSPHWAKQSFSPVASPSTGILKKRRLIEDYCSSSPSPPQKQRKVSFADPVVQSSISISVTPNDVSERSSKPVSRCLEMPKSLAVTISEQKNELEMKDTSSQSESSLPTSGEYQVTPSNFYDTNEKVFLDAASCSEPVEGILPYLTCSLFPSGLGQLLRARNIFTVGDLCSLTVPELLRLPVRSPKLETVRKAVNTYLEIYQKEKIYISIKNVKEQKETSSEDRLVSLESAEEENSNMEQMSAEKRNFVDESMYVEADEDMPLTPMPDSDNEDLYVSCDENARRSRLESVAEFSERRSVEAFNSTIFKNEPHNVLQNNSNKQKSIDMDLSKCDHSMTNNTNPKSNTDRADEDHALIENVHSCSEQNSEQECHMETEPSFELNVENVNCEEKSCDSFENQTGISFAEINSPASSQANQDIQNEMEQSKNNSIHRNQDHFLNQIDCINSENRSLGANSSITVKAFSTDNFSSIVEQLNTEASRENHSKISSDIEDVNISNIRHSENKIKSVESYSREQHPHHVVEKLHCTPNTKLEGSINISSIGSDIKVKPMQNNLLEECTNSINEQLHDSANSRLERSTNVSKKPDLEIKMASLQIVLCEQNLDLMNSAFNSTPNSNLEENIRIHSVKCSETEIKSNQDDLCESYSDSASSKLHNTFNSELEASINVSNIKCIENDLKPIPNEFQNQCSTSANKDYHKKFDFDSELDASICISNKESVDPEIKSIQNEKPDFASETVQHVSSSELEESIDISNTKGPQTENSIENNFSEKLHETCDSELKSSINISNVKSLRTEMKFVQNTDGVIFQGNREDSFNLNDGNELCSEEKKSGKDSLGKEQQQPYFLQGKEHLEKCYSNVQKTEAQIDESESSEKQIHSFAENELSNGKTSVEQNLPHYCDMPEDIIEFVDTLINYVVREEQSEKDVDTASLHLFSKNESMCRTTANKNQKDSRNKNSNLLHTELGKYDVDKATVHDFEMVLEDESKSLPLSSGLPDPNKELVNNESMEISGEEHDDMCATVSSPNTDENMNEQSKVELLQSMFTTENLKKVSLLHLIDMMDKLTAAIRIKSEEIICSSNDSKR